MLSLHYICYAYRLLSDHTNFHSHITNKYLQILHMNVYIYIRRSLRLDVILRMALDEKQMMSQHFLCETTLHQWYLLTWRAVTSSPGETHRYSDHKGWKTCKKKKKKKKVNFNGWNKLNGSKQTCWHEMKVYLFECMRKLSTIYNRGQASLKVKLWKCNLLSPSRCFPPNKTINGR